MLWILIFVILVVLAVLEWKWYNEDFNKIPGPKEYFLVGHGLEFSWNTVKTFLQFRKLSNKFQELYKVRIAHYKCVFVVNPEDAETVLTSSKLTQKADFYRILKPWLNEGLLLSSGEKWHHRRRILTPVFHFSMLKCYKPIFQENSKLLIDKLDRELVKPKIDIMSHVEQCTLNVICECAMATNLEAESHDFAKEYRNGIRTLGQLFFDRFKKFWYFNDTIYKYFSTLVRKEKKILSLLSAFRNNVIQKRRQENKEAYVIHNIDNFEDNDNVYKKKARLVMLDLLFQAQKEGTIDEQGIREEIDTFMFEGHDTTATSLQYTLMLLANHPTEQDKVVDELKDIFNTSDRSPTTEDLNRMKYLEYCIKESLRLYPPVFFIMRKFEESVQLKNYKVPAGADCSLLIFDLHRRADQFPNPLEFRPERFATTPTWHPFAYVPFSAGSRNCIGQKFALMEMKIVISSLLRRFKLLPVTEPQEIQFITDIMLRPKTPIYVKMERRAF